MRGIRFVLPVAVAVFTLFAVPASAQERIGAALDLWLDASQMSGEQSINASRLDESFDYGAAGGSVSAWALFQAKEHVRAGPGLRVYGNYGSGDNPDFLFGFLSEAFLMGEYSLRAFEKVDAIFGGRAGLAVLFPGQKFGEEIARLQRDGVGVWSLPRLGWLAGFDLGARRKMIGQLSLRADVIGQYEQLFLFADDELVDGLRYQKHWSTHSIRLGLLIGVEVAL